MTAALHQSTSIAQDAAKTDYLLVAENVAKSFSGVMALQEGRLQLKPGTVHALCGGNGAGKSTLLNIILGLLRRDAGIIRIRGEEVEFKSAGDALRHGIAFITQELSPVRDMTVSENLFLGREPRIGGIIVDFRKMKRDAQMLLDDLGFSIPTDAKMDDLSLAQIQLVEIAKALSYRADIVIMDEPTSAIGEHEVHVLFEAIRKIKARGSAIVYVSHKLTEIFEIADEYTVIRDGKFIESGRIADINRKHLVTQIVGRDVKLVEKGKPNEGAPILLSVRGLTRGGLVKDVTLDVAAGEVFGIYGLLGSGRTEFLETVFGLHKPTAGEILLSGEKLPPGSPKQSIRRGIAMVTEDRKETGLVLSSSIAHNITLSSLSLYALGGFLKRKPESAAVQNMIGTQRIKAASPDVAVETLSGGNQQKVVFSRCLLTSPKLLICDEPTRGIDEGSKQEIYAFLRDFASKGNAVLVVSSEAPEIIQISDRIAIFRKGRLDQILDGQSATQQLLIEAAS